jgi:hypothetical protein
MFQAADAAVEYGLVSDRTVYLVEDLLELKTSSEDECLTANVSFNFLFNSLKSRILEYTLDTHVDLVEFSLINDLIIATVKRKYAHVL